MKKGLLPNFICIGVPRSGTTWLYKCLNQHPESFVPERKEVCFFMEDSYRSELHRGIDWYKSHFVFEKNSQIKVWGEFSPRYYFLEKTPKLIFDTIPEAKIIYMLRHPVEMLHSMATFHINMYPNVIDGYKYIFEDYLHHHLVEPLGYYSKYYDRYNQYFNKENIYVSFQEDMNKDSMNAFKRICNFLGIDDKIDLSFSKKKVNEAIIPKFYWLSGILNHLSSVSYRFVILDKKINRKKLKNSKLHNKNKVTEEQFTKLMKVYKDDISKLEKNTNRDLSHWFNFETLNPNIRY